MSPFSSENNRKIIIFLRVWCDLPCHMRNMASIRYAAYRNHMIWIIFITHQFALRHDFFQLLKYLSSMLSASYRFLIIFSIFFATRRRLYPFKSLLTSSKFIADNGLLIFIYSIWIWIFWGLMNSLSLTRRRSEFMVHATLIPFCNNFEV